MANDKLTKAEIIENIKSKHAYVMERITSIIHLSSSVGMIIPSASICTPRMQSLMAVMKRSFEARYISLFGHS